MGIGAQEAAIYIQTCYLLEPSTLVVRSSQTNTICYVPNIFRAEPVGTKQGCRTVLRRSGVSTLHVSTLAIISIDASMHRRRL